MEPNFCIYKIEKALGPFILSTNEDDDDDEYV